MFFFTTTFQRMVLPSSSGYNCSFSYVDVHAIFQTPILHRINVILQKFRVINVTTTINIQLSSKQEVIGIINKIIYRNIIKI
jgi:hypothetical protein